MKYRYHPACLLFPQLPKAELVALAADIKDNGLQNPIVLHKGQILDGRNRWLACRIAKVKPRFVQWKGKGSPLEWVISENLIRRHLTSGQRAVVALDLLPLLEEEAGKRQTLGKNFPKVSPNGKGKSSEIAARLANTNSAYVQAVKTIKKQAPELIEKIRFGELNVPDAVELSKLPPAKRQKMVRLIDRGGGLNGKVASYVFQAGTLDNLRPNSIVTPSGVCRFLHDLISPHYRVRTILDPCAGKGALTKPWKCRTIAYEKKKRKDFFSCPAKIKCDLVLCNPPFSGNSKTRQSPVSMFLERIVTVVTPKTPIVLFAPWGFRMDQDKRSTRWRWLRDECPKITSIITLPHDIWSDAKVHSEILLFNMAKLESHYFVPDEYLR